MVQSHSLEHGYGISTMINELVESDASGTVVCGPWTSWIVDTDQHQLDSVGQGQQHTNVDIISITMRGGGGRGPTSLHKTTYVKGLGPEKVRNPGIKTHGSPVQIDMPWPIDNWMSMRIITDEARRMNRDFIGFAGAS